jgi:hypothetical protein
MVRAWVVAGRPAGYETIMGGFEEWTEIIGGILHYSGIFGFLDNNNLLHAELDAGVDEWTEFISTWYAVYQSIPQSSADLLVDIERKDLGIGKSIPSEIAEKINFKSPGNARKLTLALRKKSGVYFANGLMLKQTRDTHSKRSLWQVVRARDYALCAEGKRAELSGPIIDSGSFAGY